MENTAVGNYAGVPMEMILQLMRMDLTSREHKIIWFLIGKLQGDLMMERLIKSEEFVKATTLAKQHVNTAVRSLVEKGVIHRKPTELLGCYWYRFHEQNFGRVHAVKTIKTDAHGLRLVHSVPEIKLSTKANFEEQNGHQSSDSQMSKSHQTGDSGVTKPVTVSRSKSAQSFYRGETISQRSETKEINISFGTGTKRGRKVEWFEEPSMNDLENEATRQLQEFKESELRRIREQELGKMNA